MVESPDGVQYRRQSTHVKKFLERSNAPECEMSLSPSISNSSTEHQAQPSVNESNEHSGETHTHTVVGSAAEPGSIKETASRSIRCRTLLALRTLLCLKNRTFHQTSRQARLRTL